jgi:hypothetical protein
MNAVLRYGLSGCVAGHFCGSEQWVAAILHLVDTPPPDPAVAPLCKLAIGSSLRRVRPGIGTTHRPLQALKL